MVASFAALRRHAKAAIYGVGDARLGEWTEEYTNPNGLRLVHIRRRLKPEEQQLVGPAIDIRGTNESDRRMAACPWTPPDYTERPERSHP